jgi:hypothetical protein
LLKQALDNIDSNHIVNIKAPTSVEALCPRPACRQAGWIIFNDPFDWSYPKHYRPALQG